MTINEIQNEIIEEFADFDDWMDKYQMLIEAGNALPPLADKHKTEDNLIDGCQSRVWLVCEYAGGVMTLLADSDALIVKGIIALLLRIFNRQTPADILAADLYSIREIGLQDHLSPTRANGLLAMIKQIRTYAAVYSKK
ncbi:MAG: SufE family protein [Prevotella sp.]|nr:SufE family protein [Prevotella sp.]